MSRAQVRYLHVCIVLTALTGIVFAWMKYFLHSSDEFAVVNHPLQPHMLSAHVVVAPFLVFAFGWIFSDHIWPRFRQTGAPRRASGLWSMAAIAPMTLSAYLLQIATDDGVRKAMALAHGITSALFVIAYVIHLVMKPAPRSRPQD
jgi:Na+/proline symporter